VRCGFDRQAKGAFVLDGVRETRDLFPQEFPVHQSQLERVAVQWADNHLGAVLVHPDIRTAELTTWVAEDVRAGICAATRAHRPGPRARLSA